MDKAPLRVGKLTRTTKETDISVEINLDGTGINSIDTGIPFLDHMLDLFSKHGFFDLTVKCDGDIEIDYHHTIEDLALALGAVIKEALGDKARIRRYGSFLLPMDEALARVVLDLSGRPFLVYNVEFPRTHIKDIDVQMFHEFFYALSARVGMNLHIDLIRGNEIHHCIEGIFKGFAKALDIAVSYDDRLVGVMSTKGILD